MFLIGIGKKIGTSEEGSNFTRIADGEYQKAT